MLLFIDLGGVFMACLVISKSDEGCVGRVGTLLKEGKAGIIPCDTIYGLSAIAVPECGERLYEIKRRPQSKSFIMLMSKEDAASSSLDIPSDIMDRWPAPLTAIVRDRESGLTHAVRVPSDSFIQEVLRISGPIYSTSVNFSGEKSLLTFSEIYPVFSSLVDFAVDDPSVAGGIASTLIDATVKPYRVIRQGAYII